MTRTQTTTRPSNKPAIQFPKCYDPRNAALWAYRPDLRKVFTEATDFRTQNRIKAAAGDKTKISLLLIDVQKDFCFPEGTLYVGGRSGTGAIDDSRRMVEFIYRNVGLISEITPTLDTHFGYQIFTPSFWQDQDGNPLQPYDEITSDMTILRFGKPAGTASPNPAVAGFLVKGNVGWLQKQVEFYCKELEKRGRYKLFIWPEHCVLGTDGHALVGVASEAIMFHSYVRQYQCEPEIKGGSPLTENYSVFSPEVTARHDGQGTVGNKNVKFIGKLVSSDVVIIAGQAASHCVKSSIDDLLDEITSTDPALARKVYVLEDCTSAVAVPNPTAPGQFFADFTPQAEAALKRYADAGMNLVKSTTPIETWPGINL